MFTMTRLTIYKDDYTDSTIIPNCFIDEFMAQANDAQIKVYLYLTRMLNANYATSISDIADKFNHTEKDIMRALKYWQQQKLLSLDYDEDNNLIGINLRDLNHKKQDIKLTPKSPASDSNIPAATSKKEDSAALSVRPFSEKQEDSNQTVTKNSKSFSVDALREFRSRNETSQLLFITESYIGRPLTPNEIKSIFYFSDVLGFSEDLIDYLVQYCVDRNKKDFKYIEKVAVNWAKEGITTPEQAKQYSMKYNKNIYTIMNRLGKNTAPTPKEAEYIRRWMTEYGFSDDIILEACERTVLATDSHRFEYAEGILSSWKRQNVQYKADILRMDYLHQQKQHPIDKTATTNKFNQFTQNEYDFDALEKELLSN